MSYFREKQSHKEYIQNFLIILGNNDQVSIFVDWTKDPQVLGHYWFLIERAYLGQSQVLFHLRILRFVLNNCKSFNLYFHEFFTGQCQVQKSLLEDALIVENCLFKIQIQTQTIL